MQAKHNWQTSLKEWRVRFQMHIQAGRLTERCLVMELSPLSDGMQRTYLP